MKGFRKHFLFGVTI